MSGIFNITVLEARGFVATQADIDHTGIVLGCSSAGSGMSPFFLTPSAAVASVGYGDAVDCMCQVIAQRQAGGGLARKYPSAMYTLPVNTPGAYGTINTSGVTGSSTVTVSAASAPYGTYQAKVRVVNGGTLGSVGITYETSLDNGTNYGRITALSTAGVPSYGALTSSANSFPVALAAGDTFLGKVDQQGSATTLTITAVAASRTGSGETHAAVTPGHTLTLTIQGAEYVVTFTGSEATLAAFITTINATIAGVGFAAVSGGQLKVSSDVLGSASSGAVTAGDTDVLASTGLSVGAFSGASGTFPNVAAVTAAQFAAILTATFTGGTGGSTGIANANNSVTWRTNTAGVSPKGVQFTSGSGVAKITGFDTSEHNGTATGYALTIPNSNLTFSFTAGTLLAGDYFTVATLAPTPAAADVDAAFVAIAELGIPASMVFCEFPADAAMAAHFSTGIDALEAVGMKVGLIGRTRIPDFESDESEATWDASVRADYFTFTDDRITMVAEYGLLIDATTTNQYLRSNIAQVAADFVRVERPIWPDAPADQPMANFLVSDSSGARVGHDEGPRGGVTQNTLSNDSIGSRFLSAQRLPVPAIREDVFTTVPWTMYPSDGRIRNFMTRRIANAMEREAVNAGVTVLGGLTFYNPVDPSAPGSTATLTQTSIEALHAIIFQAVSGPFRNDIQNWQDAALDTGLVQVNPIVTVSGGNLLAVSVTLAPKVFGYVLDITLTLAVQE